MIASVPMPIAPATTTLFRRKAASCPSRVSPTARPKVGMAVSDLFAGLYATQSILAARFQRHTSGRGQFLDVALFDYQMAVLAIGSDRQFRTLCKVVLEVPALAADELRTVDQALSSEQVRARELLHRFNGGDGTDVDRCWLGD